MIRLRVPQRNEWNEHDRSSTVLVKRGCMMSPLEGAVSNILEPQGLCYLCIWVIKVYSASSTMLYRAFQLLRLSLPNLVYFDFVLPRTRWGVKTRGKGHSEYVFVLSDSLHVIRNTPFVSWSLFLLGTA